MGFVVAWKKPAWLLIGTFLTACTTSVLTDAFQPPVSIATRPWTIHPSTTLTTTKSPPTASYYYSTSSPTKLDAVNPLMVASSIVSPAVVGAVTVLAFVILIHESGHYLAARLFGIEVEEFSIGVGPKILGIHALGNDFNLRALPLGGYVRFPENYNTTLAQEIETYKVLQESKTETPFQRKLNNILSLGMYETMLEEEEAKRNLQDQEKAARRPWWTRLMGIRGKKEDDEVVVPTEIEYYDNPNLLQNRPWPERAVVIAGGVVFNLVLAFCIYLGQITGDGLPKPLFEPGARVSVTPTGNGAAVGLLNKGDVILTVNGAPISSGSSGLKASSPSALESQRAINEFIAKIQATPEGESLQLQVRVKDGKVVDLAIQPKYNGQVQAIGVQLGPNFSRMEKIRSNSIGEATKLAALAVKDLTQETASGLSQVLSTLVKSSKSGGGGPGAVGKLSGPIGLIQTGSEVVSTSDLTAILAFAAAISVNLAVVNSLPLPALDGGQMVFILVEAVSRRKVDQRVQENITSIAVLLLLLLSLSTTVGDVEGLFAK